MKPRIVLLALAAVALGGAVALGALRGSAPGSFEGTAYLPPEPAAAWTLTDHHGQPASLSDFRGRPVLLFFGFTHCPDVCPLTLTKLDRVLRSLGDDAAEVLVLLVSTDPARDTPEALSAYVARWQSPVVGLTGDSATLASVRAAYGAFATPQMPGHAMSHSTQVFGIDRDGDLRVLLPMERPDEVVAADVRALVAD